MNPDQHEDETSDRTVGKVSAALDTIAPPALAQMWDNVGLLAAERVESLAAALFAAGAGRIREYEQCSFRVSGEGTFFGTPATNPQVGQRGRLEHVPEVRLETVVPERRLPEVIASLRANHSYEEPAFDIYP